MLVQVASVANAIVQGSATGWILSEPTCLGEAALSKGHHFRYQVHEGSNPNPNPKPYP